MRLGRASAYAVLAMLSIAGASTSKSTPGNGRMHHNGACCASRIARSTGIPVEYLRKLLQRLTRARLVHSERGRAGGFRLAKPAPKISLLEIVEAIEGPVDDAAFVPRLLTRKAHPQLYKWRRHCTDGMRRLLDAQSLADLMN